MLLKKAKEKYHVDIVLDMTPESVDWIKHVKKKNKDRLIDEKTTRNHRNH
jgi:hypothetical protein